jgi:hypothetical protein
MTMQPDPRVPQLLITGITRLTIELVAGIVEGATVYLGDNKLRAESLKVLTDPVVWDNTNKTPFLPTKDSIPECLLHIVSPYWRIHTSLNLSG